MPGLQAFITNLSRASCNSAGNVGPLCDAHPNAVQNLGIFIRSPRAFYEAMLENTFPAIARLLWRTIPIQQVRGNVHKVGFRPET